jgi:hypothetical protein
MAGDGCQWRVHADSMLASERQPVAVGHEDTKNTDDPDEVFVTFVAS